MAARRPIFSAALAAAMFSVALAATMLSVAGAASACKIDGNGVVLTVAGPAVTAPNRPGFNEAADRFHAYRGNKFDKARGFTLSDLAALPMQSARAFVPYDQKVAHIDGPGLDDVLKAAGVRDFKSVTLQAVDGYEVKVDPATAAADRQVLGLCRDGVPLPLGGLGPVYSTIPLALDQSKITDDQINRQIWGLVYILVE